MRNPVLRGDVRARMTSRKILSIEAFLLGVLGVLTFLGVPPELTQADPSHQASLGLALLIVQAVLVTYFASACTLQEIAVEGEKPAVDLVFGPFTPWTVVTGKSLASLVTIVYWLLLGAPLVTLATGIRQESVAHLAVATGLIAVEAWGMTQIGMVLSITVESEFSRTLVHWITLLAIFAGTLALPGPAQWVNPVVAVMRAAAGEPSILSWILYGALGLAADRMAHASLGRLTTA